MKIAFLHHSFILGSGIDALIYQWAKRLGERHDVYVYTCRTDYPQVSDWVKGHSNLSHFENMWVLVTSDCVSRTAKGSAVFAGLSGEWKTKQVRDSLEQMDVVVTQLYPATVMLPKLKHPKWVHIEWSVPPMNLWDNAQGKMYSRLLRWGNGVGCKNADLVLTPSHFVHDWVKKEYGIESQVMFLDGIDFELFDKSKYENRYDTNNILYVGRIAPHKNLETLIKAFALVKKEIPDAKLQLVGAKSFVAYHNHLVELSRDLGVFYNVEWWGTQPWSELPKFYANCALWCSPTKWEGFLKSEAYAFEKPMVAFDYTSNRETLEHGGLDVSPNLNGDDGNAEWLAGFIIQLLTFKDRAKELGQNGYRWAKENLDNEVISKNLERVFSDIIIN